MCNQEANLKKRVGTKSQEVSAFQKIERKVTTEEKIVAKEVIVQEAIEEGALLKEAVGVVREEDILAEKGVEVGVDTKERDHKAMRNEDLPDVNKVDRTNLVGVDHLVEIQDCF